MLLYLCVQEVTPVIADVLAQGLKAKLIFE